jgi:hypothetical protein
MAVAIEVNAGSRRGHGGLEGGHGNSGGRGGHGSTGVTEESLMFRERTQRV